MKRIKKGDRNRLRKARNNSPKQRGEHATRKTRPKREYSLEHVRNMTTQLRESLTNQIQDLETILRSLSLEDLVTYILTSVMGYDPDTYRESDLDNSRPASEYLIQLRLKHGDFSGTRISSTVEPFHQVVELAKSIHMLTVFQAYTPALDETGNMVARDPKEKAAQEIIGRLYADHLTSRNSTYHHFQWELLHGLFDPFSRQLTSILGFCLEDIERLSNGMEVAMMENFDTSRSRAYEIGVIEAHGWIEQMEDDSTRFHELPALTPEELLEVATMVAATNAGMEMLTNEGCPFKFTVQQIAAYVELAPEIVESMLRFFSLAGGDVPVTYELPSVNAPMRLRPIIMLDQTHFVLPAGYLFPWSIQERLEHELGQASANDGQFRTVRNRYEKKRAFYVESTSLGWINKALPGAKTYQGLTYTTQDETGQHGWELDGLVIYDCHILLIEAKSGGLNNPAREGSIGRMKERIEKLVSEAHHQVGRAAAYILDADQPVFTCNGVRIPIDKSQIYSVIPVTVSLESFGGISASYNDLITAGLSHHRFIPWAVPYHDLRIICELSELPSVFLAYVRERLRMSDEAIIKTHDEISWFGWFLKEGLRFPSHLSNADRMLLTSGTEEIDNYFLAEMGQRTVATDKPTLHAPEAFLQVLRELTALDIPGKSWIASRFLACDNGDRAVIADHLEIMRKETLLDGKCHDFSLTYEEGGLSVLSCLSAGFPDAIRRFTSFVEGKKYQGKRPWWIFLISCADQPNLVAYAGSLIAPHLHNEILEESIRRLPSAKSKTKGPEPRMVDMQGLDYW